MPDPQDPKPTSRPAAQDDVLGEAARNTGTGSLEEADATTAGPSSSDGREDGEAQPGKDENQAGFLKDGDKRFSP